MTIVSDSRPPTPRGSTPLGGPDARRRSAASSPPSPARARRSSWPARPRRRRGRRHTMPVFAVAAGGGVVVDVDGNSLIDLGSGIAVTTVGNAHPGSSTAVRAQVDAVHPHVLHDLAVRGLRRRRRGAQPAHPRRPREAHRAVQLRRRGGRERGQDRPQATPKKQAVVAFDHAYHGRTNLTMALTAKACPTRAASARSPPRSTARRCRYPFRDGGLERCGGRAAARSP